MKYYVLAVHTVRVQLIFLFISIVLAQNLQQGLICLDSRLILHLKIDYFGLMMDEKTKTTDSAFWVKIAIFLDLLQKYL